MTHRVNFKSPGPKYAAPTTVGYENADPRRIRAPAYTIGQLLRPKAPGTRIPGPKYDVSNITRRGAAVTVSALLVDKRKETRPPRNPGPAAYDIGPCLPVTRPAMPMHSIGIRREPRRKTTRTPAPNAYSLGSCVGNAAPDMRAAPAYSMGGRRAEPPPGRASPGPARYAPVSVDQFKGRTAPRPVILDRPAWRRGARTPAPNAYLPVQWGSRYASTPQFTIAGRIPSRSDPFYTAADLVPDWQ